MRLLLLFVIAVTIVSVEGFRRRQSHGRSRLSRRTTTTASPSDPDTIAEKVQVLWNIFKKYEQKGVFKTENVSSKRPAVEPAHVHLHIHTEDAHHEHEETDDGADQDHEEHEHANHRHEGHEHAPHHHEDHDHAHHHHEDHEHADHHEDGEMTTDHDHNDHHKDDKHADHAHVHLHVQVEPSKMMQKMLMNHRHSKEGTSAYGVCFMIPNSAETRPGQVIGMLLLKQEIGKDTEMRVMLRGLDVEEADDHDDHVHTLFLHEAGIVALGACENVGKVVKYGETDVGDGNVGSFACDAMGNVNTNLTTDALTLFGDSSAFGRTIVMQDNDGTIPSCCVVFRTTSDYWTGKKQFPRRGPQPTF